MLCRAFGLGYLSTGDAIREEIRRSTSIGRRIEVAIAEGRFADDESIFAIVLDRLDRDVYAGGFVFDGFPRTLAQARRFDELLDSRGRRVDAALLLSASETTLLERLAGRVACTDCGAPFHLQLLPPKNVDVCDDCGGALERRIDDDPMYHRRKLEIYDECTAQLEEYYRHRGVLLEVNADQRFAAVSAELMAAVRGPRLAGRRWAVE